MIVHELATNAIKYGALSNDIGMVTVEWSIEPAADHDELRLTWRERGGPAVVEPAQRGFGTRLIGSGISSRRGTHVEMSFEPEGLVCVLQVSLEREDD